MQEKNSLSEIHDTLDTERLTGWRKIASFFGPALLVSIGYMDPGNWATDLEAGSRFGYDLLFILVVSNLMALVLQMLSLRLGIVRRKDLAQVNRELYPRSFNLVLYLFAEIAITATDLAEVLGVALGLELLFGIDLFWGVLITLVDTLLILYLQKLGVRKIEGFILGLIFIISAAFVFQLLLSRPDLGALAGGMAPRKLSVDEVYISIGIIGATVMPHNLYLHSSFVQSRKIGADEGSIRKALKYNFWDTALALNFAFFVNAAILVLAASTFHSSGHEEATSITEAYKLLSPILSSHFAPIAFGIALIAAGQSSTVTGTLAGQIVMEGYLNLRMSLFWRQMMTRLLAIIPAEVMIVFYGESHTNQLLIFSQVVLSLQLSFAVIPLILAVSSREKMGRFAIQLPLKLTAWLIAAIVCGLNLYWFFAFSLGDFTHLTPGMKLLGAFGIAAFVAILALAFYFPLRRRHVA